MSRVVARVAASVEVEVGDRVLRRYACDSSTGVSRVVPGRVTLGWWLHEWLRHRSSSLRPSTVGAYRSVIRAADPIAHIRLGDLSADDIEALYGVLLEAGRATGTVRNLHTLLRTACTAAVTAHVIASNPMDGVSAPRVVRAERQVWTPAQVAVFVDGTETDRLAALWRVAAMSGMRRGELLGLGWDDVDLDTSQVHVRRALTRGPAGSHLGPVKTVRGRRSVHLDARTMRLLRRWRATQTREAFASGRDRWSANNPQQLVFTRPDGHPCHPDTITSRFNRIVTRLDLPRIRFHDLRHTHATLLLTQGAPLHLVSRRIGHASAALTADIYAHVLPDHTAAVVQQLAARIDGDET